MARFVLTPCRVREDRMVPDGEAVVLGWSEVAALLAPSRSQSALMTLRRMKPLSYVGLVKNPTTAAVTNFLVQNDDKSNSLKMLLKFNPAIVTQLVSLYRVDEVSLDAKVEEISTGEPI